MKYGNRIAAIAAAATLALGACTGGVAEPDIDLEGVSIGSLGLTGGTLVASVRIHNPNRFSLRADDLRYRLYIREPQGEPADSTWLEFAEGTYGDSIIVRGRETRTFRIPVEFSYAGVRGAAGTMLRTGRVQCRAEGTVDVRPPIGVREFPFRKTGSVMMSGAGR